MCLYKKRKTESCFLYSPGGVWLPDPASTQGPVPRHIRADVWDPSAGVLLEASVEGVGELQPMPLARSRHCFAKNNGACPSAPRRWCHGWLVFQSRSISLYSRAFLRPSRGWQNYPSTCLPSLILTQEGSTFPPCHSGEISTMPG